MDIFKALGNPNRRNMLQILMKKETHISALAKEVNISTPVALRHVKILEDVGLIERKKIGNTHVLAIKQEALEKIKKVWDLFEKSLIVKVPKTTTLLKALKKVPGLKIEENPDGAFITAVDGKKGYYIYEVNGKIPNLPANEFKINKDLDVELKKLIPVIGKKIKIKVE